MIIPIGWPSVFEDALEQLFSSSPTLQDATGKTPEQLREENIFNDYSWYEQTDDGVLKSMRPLVVFREDELTITRDTFTANRSQGNLWAGSVGVLITDNAIHQGNNDPIHHKESKRNFVNFVGSILDDIEQVAGVDVNLGFQAIEMVMPYTRTPLHHRSVNNDIWEFGLAVRFGIGE